MNLTCTCGEKDAANPCLACEVRLTKSASWVITRFKENVEDDPDPLDQDSKNAMEGIIWLLRNSVDYITRRARSKPNPVRQSLSSRVTKKSAFVAPSFVPLSTEDAWALVARVSALGDKLEAVPSIESRDCDDSTNTNGPCPLSYTDAIEQKRPLCVSHMNEAARSALTRLEQCIKDPTGQLNGLFETRAMTLEVERLEACAKATLAQFAPTTSSSSSSSSSNSSARPKKQLSYEASLKPHPTCMCGGRNTNCYCEEGRRFHRITDATKGHCDGSCSSDKSESMRAHAQFLRDNRFCSICKVETKDIAVGHDSDGTNSNWYCKPGKGCALKDPSVTSSFFDTDKVARWLSQFTPTTSSSSSSSSSRTASQRQKRTTPKAETTDRVCCVCKQEKKDIMPGTDPQGVISWFCKPGKGCAVEHEDFLSHVAETMRVTFE